MEEKDIIKLKLESIIKKNPDHESTPDFQRLLDELDSLDLPETVPPKKGILSRMLQRIRSMFIKQVETPATSDEKYEEIKNAIVDAYSESILKKQYSVRNNEIGPIFFYSNLGRVNNQSLGGKLYTEVAEDFIYKARTREKQEGKITVYPWNIAEDEFRPILDDEYRRIAEEYLTTEEMTEEEAFNKRVEELAARNRKMKETLKKKQIVPYYGEPEFIEERASYILECMETILTDQGVREEERTTTRKLIQRARDIVKTIKTEKEALSHARDYSIYDKMSEGIQELLSFEDVILPDIEQVWNNFLTEPEDYREGERFAFFVHALSRADVEPNKIAKLCCTLATNECMPIPGDYGFITGFNPANICTMCTEDAGSWVTDQNEFVEGGLRFQFADRISQDGRTIMYFETGKVSKIILPSTMQRDMISNNERCNSRDRYGEYTETIMKIGDRGEHIPIKGRFYIDEKGKQEQINQKDTMPLIKLDPTKGTKVPFRLPKDNDNSLER